MTPKKLQAREQEPTVGALDELLPGHVPIRVVAQRTGVNPVTLRAWERRYGLVRPHRTPKGHRLYSEAEIERIVAIVGWLERGVSISQVRGLLDRAPSVSAAQHAVPDSDWERFTARAMAGIDGFDENRLDETMNEAMSLYPFLTVHERLVQPVLHALAARSPLSPGDAAAHAFFLAYLRRKLSARALLGARHVGGPRILMATPGGGEDIDMLTLAVAMTKLEWQPLIIPDAVPLADLPVVHQRRACAAMVLHVAGALDTAELRQLSLLVQNAGIPVAVTGPGARIHEQQLGEVGALALTDDSWATVLRRLAEALS